MISKNTKPELKIRYYLRNNKIKYLIHDKTLPGKPDIVLPKYKTVINVNGCFWHQHGCTCANIPNTKKEFWYNKFKKIKSKDIENRIKLETLGWNVIDLWECAIMNEKSFNNILKTLFFKIEPVDNNIKYIYV